MSDQLEKLEAAIRRLNEIEARLRVAREKAADPLQLVRLLEADREGIISELTALGDK